MSAPPPVEVARLGRYGLVGLVATLGHYAVLIGLVEWAHWPSWAAAGAGAVFGAQLAYVGNRWFTFAHRGSVARSWPRFQLTAAVGALAAMVLVALAEALGLHYLFGQLLATAVAMFLTFVINRRWAFGTTP